MHTQLVKTARRQAAASLAKATSVGRETPIELAARASCLSLHRSNGLAQRVLSGSGGPRRHAALANTPVARMAATVAWMSRSLAMIASLDSSSGLEIQRSKTRQFRLPGFLVNDTSFTSLTRSTSPANLKRSSGLQYVYFATIALIDSPRQTRRVFVGDGGDNRHPADQIDIDLVDRSDFAAAIVTDHKLDLPRIQFRPAIAQKPGAVEIDVAGRRNPADPDARRVNRLGEGKRRQSLGLDIVPRHQLAQAHRHRQAAGADAVPGVLELAGQALDFGRGFGVPGGDLRQLGEGGRTLGCKNANFADLNVGGRNGGAGGLQDWLFGLGGYLRRLRWPSWAICEARSASK